MVVCEAMATSIEQVPERAPVEYVTLPTSVCAISKSATSVDVRSRVVVSTGWDVKRHTSPCESFIPQSASVSVVRRWSPPSESVEPVPLIPKRPCSGHVLSWEYAFCKSVTQRASKCLGDVKVACGCPSDVPRRVPSAEAIDWTCSVVRSVPGRVESLQAARSATATIVAHDIHFLLGTAGGVKEKARSRALR